MRKLFLITVIILCCSFNTFPQVNITVACQDSWGPGRFNKVIFNFDFGKTDGFARFTQEFPVGFEIIKENTPGCDFNWFDDKLNVIWIRLSGKTETFSYFIKPGQSMYGSFEMNGRLVLITGGDTRETVVMKERHILIEGTNGLLPEEMKTGQEALKETAFPGNPSDTAGIKSDMIEFRVQVYVSYSAIPANDIKKRFGIDPEAKISIVRMGQIYKYQAGSYPDYNSAGLLLKQLIERGVNDAFIVAYKGDKQISLEKATMPSK